MFGKVKRWLGIEGVKLELIVPEEINRKTQMVSGKVRFSSMHAQKVTSIKVKMVERFVRGRGKDKMIDEYVLGKIELKKSFEIPTDENIEIEFDLAFDLMKSDMDKMQEKNLVVGGLIQAAKWMRGVKSDFRIEAEAEVSGTALNPFDKKTVVLGSQGRNVKPKNINLKM